MATNIPNFVPVIGSSFDNIAQQQAGFAGYNAGVEKQNLDSFVRANDARNNYLATVAAMQRADAQNDQAAQTQAGKDAESRFQFNANQALQLRGQDIDLSKDAAKNAREIYEYHLAKAQDDAKGDLKAVSDLVGGGHYDKISDIVKALPTATDAQIQDLWDQNTKARQRIGQQYDFAGNIAKKENLKTGLTDMAAALPASKDVKPAYDVDSVPQSGLLTAVNYASGGIPSTISKWLGTSAPDTSWYDARKAAMTSDAAGLGRALAPVEKQGLDQNGVILDPVSGKYKPATTPAWVGQTAAAAPVQKPSFPPAPSNPAARVAGKIYTAPNGAPFMWTGTGWRQAQ